MHRRFPSLIAVAVAMGVVASPRLPLHARAQDAGLAAQLRNALSFQRSIIATLPASCTLDSHSTADTLRNAVARTCPWIATVAGASVSIASSAPIDIPASTSLLWGDGSTWTLADGTAVRFAGKPS